MDDKKNALVELSQLKSLTSANAVEKNDLSYSIVFVDDEMDVSEFFQDQARNLNLSTHYFKDALSAHKFITLNKNEIICIFSDIKMPKKDGMAFRREVQKIDPSIPFAILSGFIDSDYIKQGQELNINFFIQKPFQMEELEVVLISEVPERIRKLKEEKEILDGFIIEASYNLERAEELALNIEQDHSDYDSFNNFFGIIHTIKGGSGFFEPKSLHNFAHEAENYFKKVQNKEIQITSKVISSILKCIDIMRGLTEEFKTKKHQEHQLEDLLRDLFTTEKTISQSDITTDTNSEKTSIKKGKSKEDGNSDIRVPIKELDDFMHISGEMTVIRNMLNKCLRSIETQFSCEKDFTLLSDLLGEMHKLNSSVQSKVSELRKIPVKMILKPLPRLVRDLAIKLGKDVDLFTEGDDLKLDTSLAGILGNCFIHLVRNSIDHGIESKEERAKFGKALTGRLNIISKLSNDNVIISLTDDGKGLSVEKIKEKLFINGLYTKEQISQLPMEKIYEAIFEPGFSTAEKETEVSGRGVGMSMVKSSIEGLGGKIQITSEKNVGTTFDITIPIPKSTLIKSCLFVNISGVKFGITKEEVNRLIVINEEEQSKILVNFNGTPLLTIDNQIITIYQPKKILHLDRQKENPEIGNRYFIFSSIKGKQVAIEVDEILEFEDSVIRPINNLIKSLAIYKGATFLDDGTVGLILDIEGLVEKSGISPKMVTSPIKSSGESESKKSTLRIEKKSLILFELFESEGLFSLELKDIFRIEHICRKEVKYTNGLPFVPYQGKLLHLVELEGLLFKEREDINKFEGHLNIIAIKKKEIFFGLVVNSVLDFLEVDWEIFPLLKQQFGIEGNIFWKDRVVTLLDLVAIIDSRRKIGS